MNNPFSLDFGAEPHLYIPRIEEQNKILSTFTSETPSNHIFLILGARGSGKTVLMTNISHKLKEEKNWTHIDLNVESDLLKSMAAKLSKKQINLKVNLSVNGMGVSLEENSKYADIQADLDSMLEALAKKKMRLLITIDEIVNSKNVREFTTYYQHCLRENYPVFVLMTGLYKNIRALQNDRSQTFLKRAPRINLGPLNTMRIAKKYEDTFEISTEKAIELSRYTMGYSYGFQILGYYLFDNNKKEVDKDILFEYKMNLIECSYDKIWEELSPTEKEIVKTISKLGGDTTVKQIKELLNIDSNNFSTYQNTLEYSGILIENIGYGKVKFGLPFFKDFVDQQF